MDEQKKELVVRCPYCDKCVGLKDESNSECIRICVHKTPPPVRPQAMRVLSHRRCSKCKKDFVIEVYTMVAEMFRFLIDYDNNAIPLEVFKENKDIVESLRKDKRFMKLFSPDE